MKEKLAGLFVSATLAVSMLFGCADSGAANNAQATAENPVALNLAHDLAESHITSITLQQFADEANEKSEGRLQIRTFPNDTFGSETKMLEQLMVGVVDMTRVSAPGLATYDEGYHAFGLPYIFDNDEDYYEAMGSDATGEFFRSSKTDDFVALTCYTSSFCSFYTIDGPICKSKDSRGLEMRAQDMKSQTDMMKALGGTPVTMAMGDVYTAFQIDVTDGSENSETVFTTGMHSEICKYFSVDQHIITLDVSVIATDTWNNLSEEDRQILLDVARNSTDNHILEWETAVNDALEAVKTEMGVATVGNVGKEASRQVATDMTDEYREQYPEVGAVLDIIDSVEQGGDYGTVFCKV